LRFGSLSEAKRQTEMGKTPHPAKMRRLRLLVVLIIAKYWRSKMVRPAKRGISLVRGYRLGVDTG